jgi:hypothetical protein
VQRLVHFALVQRFEILPDADTARTAPPRLRCHFIVEVFIVGSPDVSDAPSSDQGISAFGAIEKAGFEKAGHVIKRAAGRPALTLRPACCILLAIQPLDRLRCPVYYGVLSTGNPEKQFRALPGISVCRTSPRGLFACPPRFRYAVAKSRIIGICANNLSVQPRKGSVLNPG